MEGMDILGRLICLEGVDILGRYGYFRKVDILGRCGYVVILGRWEYIWKVWIIRKVGICWEGLNNRRKVDKLVLDPESKESRVPIPVRKEIG